MHSSSYANDFFIVKKDNNDCIYYSIYGEKIQCLVIIFGKYLFETGLTNRKFGNFPGTVMP